MSEALQFSLVLAGIFALNLLPAFGPPTSAVLVAVSLNLDLPEAPLILGGALAAASGRFVLANGARHVRGRLSAERRRHLVAAEDALLGHRGGAIAGLGLFALSPIPSGQLFVAAGLMRVRLLPLTAAFFSGRLVSYTIYVTGAAAIEVGVGGALTAWLSSPLGIALQLLALLGLALLVRVDWANVLARGSRGTGSADGLRDARGAPSSSPGQPEPGGDRGGAPERDHSIEPTQVDREDDRAQRRAEKVDSEITAPPVPERETRAGERRGEEAGEDRDGVEGDELAGEVMGSPPAP